ncbi:helix-turn-helix transcriptional regulator [Deinococcus yavapaiensis]|uniref:DNA-binding NarL/FixJ family response regulator n=1 Tax=Deinococcus yavapaiensis KR-236 TaxID=694435 RepID=A0A318S5Z3_9DEIO|nr:response regulator transcription factor [Deinococcus yavapaiensis]PYE51814.1 DNA-binding NarL/FixJ family response regulator [Deinococcus yavapaiensis KR-236]
MTDAGARVLIGAASPSVRAELRALLPNAKIVGELASPLDLDAAPGADVLVVDAAFARLVEVLPSLPPPALVVLGADEETFALVRTLRPSGWALLPFDATAEELSAGLASAFVGLAVLPLELADVSLAEVTTLERASGDFVDIEPLTPRERDVLVLLANGDPNKRIAAKLDISENTVKFHLSALYSKLGVSSRAAALREGVRRGLVSV